MQGILGWRTYSIILITIMAILALEWTGHPLSVNACNAIIGALAFYFAQSAVKSGAKSIAEGFGGRQFGPEKANPVPRTDPGQGPTLPVEG
jgi:hypothetical protein